MHVELQLRILLKKFEFPKSDETGCSNERQILKYIVSCSNNLTYLCLQLTEIIKSREAREKVLGVQDKIRTNTMSSTLTRNSSIRDFDMQNKDNKVCRDKTREGYYKLNFRFTIGSRSRAHSIEMLDAA